MGLGLAVVKWPVVVGYDRSMPLFEGIVAVVLTAMSLLAFLGLRYPFGCCRSCCSSAPGRPSGWPS
jgi:hypothetical protein